MRSTKNYEDLFYKYSYTLYHLKDYLTASYQFKSFTEAFPQSEKEEEASYMYAYCLYQDSPNYNLDPTNTIKARDALANFVYTHPNSPRITDALKYAQECLNKLESKNFSSATLYYNMGQFKAAKIAFLQLIIKFPDSKLSDYYQMMAVKSSYFYAKNSDYLKQEERYVETLAVYTQMKDIFPESKHIEEAEKYNKLSEKNIKTLKNEH